MTLSAHQSASSRNEEWLTPPEILRALGPFDLDPCAPVVRPWNMAKDHYTVNEDGLSRPWYGRVWLNPPFTNRVIGKWLKAMCKHRNGIALVPARTETAYFFDYVWHDAMALLFLKGRPHFHYVDGPPAQPRTAERRCASSPTAPPTSTRSMRAVCLGDLFGYDFRPEMS